MRGKNLIISILICVVFCLSSNPGYAFTTECHGHLQTNYVLRDTNGFQNKFMDDVVCSQWLTELKFDLTVRPENMVWKNITVHKLFFTYRGAYDAVFDVTDRWDNIRDKSPDDWELGKDDLKVENDLREAFVDIVGDFGEQQSVVLRLGRQIVQWGEADGFNVVNIVNPQDNSNRIFFDKPEDLAIPLWMLRADYTTGRIGIFDSIDLQLVLIPDVRPYQLAPLTNDERDIDAYEHNNAPYAFNFKYIIDWGIPSLTTFAQDTGVGPAKGALMQLIPGSSDGVSVADGSALLHDVYPVLAPGGQQVAQARDAWVDATGRTSPEFFQEYPETSFLYLLKDGGLEAKPFISLKEEGPDRHIDNLEYGGKVRFGYDGSELSFYYLRSYQDTPAIDLSRAFTEQTLWFQHPKQDMFGFSFNTYIGSINAVIRGEGNYVSKMAIADMHLDYIKGLFGTLPEELVIADDVATTSALYDVTGDPAYQNLSRDQYIQVVEGMLGFDIGLDPYNHPKGYEMYPVSQWLLGFDKSMWLRWLNSHNMINMSLQAYWKHIHDWKDDIVPRPWDQQENYRLTGFFYTDYMSGKIHPELFVMYDTKDAWMTNLSIKFTRDGQWFFKWGIMAFWGDEPKGCGTNEDQYSQSARNPFTAPLNLIKTSEMSFMVGYNW